MDNDTQNVYYITFMAGKEGTHMHAFLPIFLFSASASVTPGPNNIMVMTSSLNYGVRKTLPHFLGICLGFPLMVFAVSAGFGTLFLEFPMLHQVIKIAGAIFLLYLSWHIATTTTDLDDEKQHSKPFTFLQAVLFQWVNPKAWIMIISAVSAFTTVGGNMTMEVLTIAAAFFVCCLPAVAIWLLCGVALKKLIKNKRQQRVFNILMGISLALSVLIIFLNNI